MFLGIFGGRGRESAESQAWKEDDLLGASSVQAIADAPHGVEEVVKAEEAVPASELADVGQDDKAVPASELAEMTPPPEAPPTLSLAPDVGQSPAETLTPVVEATPVAASAEMSNQPEIVAPPSDKSLSKRLVDRILQRELENAA